MTSLLLPSSADALREAFEQGRSRTTSGRLPATIPVFLSLSQDAMAKKNQASDDVATDDTTIVLHNPEEVLRVALLVPREDPRDPACRWGAPLLLWGPPGVSKSTRVKDAGRRLGLPVETLCLSPRLPEDLAGTPLPDGLGGANVVCLLPGVRTLMKAGRGVLFLDELTCARESTQGAALNLVQEGVVGDLCLPPGVRILAAANPPEEAAGGFDLPPPTSNRFLHMQLAVPSVDEWGQWLLQRTPASDPTLPESEDAVREAWPAAYAQAAALFGGFHRSTRTKLYAMPPEGSPQRSRAWASPRTWAMAAQCYATCLALNKLPLAGDFVAACVGQGLALEFLAWSQKLDLPHPADMLERGWTPNTVRLDLSFAAISAMVSYVAQQANPAERERLGQRAWGLLDRVYDAGLADLVQAPATALYKAGLGVSTSPALRQAAAPLMTKLGHSRFLQGV